MFNFVVSFADRWDPFYNYYFSPSTFITSIGCEDSVWRDYEKFTYQQVILNGYSGASLCIGCRWYNLYFLQSYAYVYVYIRTQKLRLQRYEKNPIYANIYGKFFQKCWFCKQNGRFLRKNIRSNARFYGYQARMSL